MCLRTTVLLKLQCKQLSLFARTLVAQVTTYGHIPGRPGAGPWPAFSLSAGGRLHKDEGESAANQQSLSLLRGQKVDRGHHYPHHIFIAKFTAAASLFCILLMNLSSFRLLVVSSDMTKAERKFTCKKKTGGNYSPGLSEIHFLNFKH